MVIKIFDKAADQLVANGNIPAEDKEIYTYGLQQGVIIIFNIITTIVIGLIFGMVWQSLVFLVAYIPIRMFAGGYHATTQLRCYIFSAIMIALVLLVIRTIPANYITALNIIGVIISSAIIYVLAPVEDSNKPLDATEVIIYKKSARLILVIEVSIITSFMVFNLQVLALTTVISLLTLSLMLILGKIKDYSIN